MRHLVSDALVRRKADMNVCLHTSKLRLTNTWVIVMAQRFEETLFSVEHLPREEGLKTWRQSLAEVYCRQDVQILQDDNLVGQISRRSVGGIIVSRFRSGGAQRVRRTKQMAAEDNVEHFHFALPLSGKFSLQQAGVDIASHKGDAFILNASSEFQIDFSPDAEDFVIAIPCDTVRKRIVGIDDFVSRKRIASPFVIYMLVSGCSNILESEADLSDATVQNIVLDLLDLGVEEAQAHGAQAAGSAERSSALVDQVRTVIRDGFSDPSFGLGAAAMACGVSARQIQKVLYERTTTFGQELLGVRMAKASHLLRTKSESAMSIRQIALHCGFTHQSHFSSRYRQHFGLSPREARRQR